MKQVRCFFYRAFIYRQGHKRFRKAIGPQERSSTFNIDESAAVLKSAYAFLLFAGAAEKLIFMVCKRIMQIDLWGDAHSKYYQHDPAQKMMYPLALFQFFESLLQK